MTSAEHLRQERRVEFRRRLLEATEELLRGGASFTELDKQGRLVGLVNVTETDPAGDPLSIQVDLTW